MQDMRDLYKAYAAVHDTTIKEELDNSKDQITEMNLSQMTEGDLVEVCEEIVEGLFQYGLDLDGAYGVVGDILEAASDNIIGDRKNKIVSIAEAFEKVFETVTDKAERNCEEAFLLYRKQKPLTEKWNNKVSHETGNAKIHAAIIHEDRECVRSGLIEMISDVMEREDPLKKQQEMNRAGRKGVDRLGTAIKSVQDKPEKKTDDDAAAKRRSKLKAKFGKSINTGMREEVSTLRQGWGDAYSSIYEKKLDPVGQEDGDIDNDGDKDSSDKYLAKRRKAIGKAIKKEEVDQYVDFLISEGYDCSDLTWDDMSEEYQSLDEGLRSAVMGLLNKKKEEPAKPMSRGDQLRKKYNVGPEKSDTSAKAQILQRTRAKADRDQKQYGDSSYSKGVAAKSKAAHERQLKGGYSKYGADDARGSGNKARKRAAALSTEGLDPKGAARMDAAKGKKKETQDQINKRLMLGKYAPGAKKESVEFSQEELDRIEQIVNSWED